VTNDEKVDKRLPEREGEQVKNITVQRRGNRIHWSTVEERVRMISQMVAQSTHGLVSQLSRIHQVSRQTLYRWSATGRQT
jgi:hypothetical protein